ncbi:MAG: YkgJ family cysteine cluster protein [Pseudomonadales bacterium]|nr:YkgJ family cysteine cluster protein [Pseudomonadales bacterium]
MQEIRIPIREAFQKHDSAIACGAGCSYCCNYRVEAFVFEIVAIYYFMITKLPQSQVEKCRSEIKEKASHIHTLSEAEHHQTNIACPFLNSSNHTCMIYPVRPLACASFYSLDASICHKQFETKRLDITGPGIPEMNYVGTGVQNAIEQVIAQENDDPGRYELITTLHYLFSNPKALQVWRKRGRF